jgi:hypothetical protein
MRYRRGARARQLGLLPAVPLVCVCVCVCVCACVRACVLFVCVRACFGSVCFGSVRERERVSE